MSEYIYLIHPLRYEFFENPTPEENACMQEHFLYLKHAAEDGRLILAGPCLDDSFGLVVFRAEDDRMANAFMHSDPAVRANVMMAELHPFRLSLFGKPNP